MYAYCINNYHLKKKKTMANGGNTESIPIVCIKITTILRTPKNWLPNKIRSACDLCDGECDHCSLKHSIG